MSGSGKGKRFTKALIEGTAKVTEEDVRDAAGRRDEVEARLEEPSLIERFGDRIRLFLSAIDDYSSGRYRDIPWRTIAMAAFAVVYFLNPADIFPDIIPISGFIDDAGVVAAAFAFLVKDLEKYSRWKKAQGDERE